MGGREEVTPEDESIARALCERLPTDLLNRWQTLTNVSLQSVLTLTGDDNDESQTLSNTNDG
jgi:hypothetical protein